MPVRGKRYVPSPKLWGPPNLLLNAYRSFLWSKTSRKVTTNLQPMPGPRMHGAIPIINHTTCGMGRAILSFKLPTGKLVTQKLRRLLQPQLLPSVTRIRISFPVTFPIIIQSQTAFFQGLDHSNRHQVTCQVLLTSYDVAVQSLLHLYCLNSAPVCHHHIAIGQIPQRKNGVRHCHLWLLTLLV